MIPSAHCVQQPHQPFWSENQKLRIHQVPSAIDNLIWLIEYEPGKCAAVDGPSAKQVLAYCEQKNLHLTTIINTHTHADHIGINRDLQRRGMLHKLRVIGAAARAEEIPGISEKVADGDTIQLGETAGLVMLTEGHINGHISILLSNILFCGDTLFAAGCGYLFDGPPEKMHHSLQRLASLPPETLVCCAHEYTEDNLRFAWSLEPDNLALKDRIIETLKQRALGRSVVPSTIALERQTNPFLRFHSPSITQELARWEHRFTHDDPASIFAATRLHKDQKHYRKQPWPPQY